MNHSRNDIIERFKEKGKDRFPLSLWLPEKRASFCSSIEKKFNISKASIWYRGLVSLVEKERDIQANIALGNYVMAYLVPTSHKLLMNPPKRAKYNIIYIYDMMMSKDNKYIILYKENNSYDDLDFKGKEINEKYIDADIIAQFPYFIEKGIPK